MHQPLQYELILQQAQGGAAQGAVPPALQPYVGATHFKDGNPLPPWLLAAAAAAERNRPRSYSTCACILHSLKALGGFLRFLWVVIFGSIAIIFYVYGVFQFIFAGTDPTPPSYGGIACRPMSQGQWALVSLGTWGLPQIACVALKIYGLASRDSPKRRDHLNVLYMLYVQDSCEGITGASPVHVFLLNGSVYTVLSDGTHSCRMPPHHDVR